MAVVKQLWICINTEVEEVKSKFSVIWAFFILICSHDTKSIATRNPHISNISQRLQAFNSLYSSWWWHWNDDITLKYTHVLNFCFGGQGKKGKQDDLLCNVLVHHMLTGLEIKWGEKWGKHEELSKGGKVIPAYIILILSAITLIASFSPCSQSPLLPPSHFCPGDVYSYHNHRLCPGWSSMTSVKCRWGFQSSRFWITVAKSQVASLLFSKWTLHFLAMLIQGRTLLSRM